MGTEGCCFEIARPERSISCVILYFTPIFLHLTDLIRASQNFKLYSGLKPSILKKAVTFIGHDNGTAQTYSVRVPTEENAKELKEALEREVAFIKAKEAS